MIPSKDQTCLYKGDLVTVIDIDYTPHPTCYIIRFDDGSELRTDDTPSFTPAPAGMSAAEDMAAENARLRGRVAELEADVNSWIESFTSAHAELARYKKDEDRRSHLFDI